jgi:hypothetical protein
LVIYILLYLYLIFYLIDNSLYFLNSWLFKLNFMVHLHLTQMISYKVHSILILSQYFLFSKVSLYILHYSLLVYLYLSNHFYLNQLYFYMNFLHLFHFMMFFVWLIWNLFLSSQIHLIINLTFFNTILIHYTILILNIWLQYYLFYLIILILLILISFLLYNIN